MKKFKKFLLDYAPILAIIGGILVTIGLSFSDQIPSEKTLSYLLCADAGLAVSTFFAIQKSEQSAFEIKAQMKISSLSKKTTRKESYKSLKLAASGVQKEIRIMTIDPHLNRGNRRSFPERNTYYNQLKKIAKKRRITIHRIYGLPADDISRQDRISWIKDDLQTIKDFPNYHIAIFDWRKFSSTLTPLSLQIIDDTFINFVSITQSDGVIGGGEDICCEDQNVVQYFIHYYEALWKKCDKLKIGDQIFENIL